MRAVHPTIKQPGNGLSKRAPQLHTFAGLPSPSSRQTTRWRLPSKAIDGEIDHAVKGWLAKTAAAVISAAILLPNPGVAEELTLRFKASTEPETRAAQQTLVEAWAYVSTSYLDPSFNGNDWQQVLRGALDDSFSAGGKQGVYKLISRMLKQLDDPFTRFLPPAAAETFEAQREGKVQAIGLGVEPDGRGRLMVGFVADGSPAQAAGVLVGDELVAVNGRIMRPDNARQLAQLLGQEVDLKIKRSSLQAAAAAAAAQAAAQQEPAPVLAPVDATVAPLPAMVPASEEPPELPPLTAYPTPTYLSLHIAPGPVDVQPVQYAVLRPSTRAAAPASGGLGYIRLLAFSSNSSQLVAEAIRDLSAQGVSGLLLDLRDNPGGVVSEGIEIAKDFLPDGSVFCYTTERSGGEQPALLQETHVLASAPLAVLVNGNTASTSELLAAALHDDLGATLVGERTFGKGRTQRVVGLSDGSTLLVSTMSYRTPKQRVVDKVGLAPDVVCRPPRVVYELWQGGSVGGGSLLDDPCIDLAARKLARQAR